MKGTKGQSSFTTKVQHEREASRRKLDEDSNRSTKKAIGTIHKIDPRETGTLSCTAWVSKLGQGRRLWGDGREIIIIDSPLDLLMRFGGLQAGMIIEITWRGIGESSKAYAKVLAEATEDETLKNGDQIPDRNVDTQSSLPFEPFGLLS